MRFSTIGALIALSSVSVLASIGSVGATSYAAPPPNEGHPNASGGYEQSYVTANANLRSGPGQKHRTIARLKRGDFVNVGECRGSWCFVEAGGKPSGWVSGRLIGRGENPYQNLGPAGPGIPPQEPGTYR